MENITPVEILMLNYVGDGIKQDMKFPGYWQYQYGVNAQEVIVGLLNKNLLRIADVDVSLQHMEVKGLKEILSSVGLKVSGKKDDLVERIFNGVDKQSLLTLGLPTYFIRTDAGDKVLEENARPDLKEYLEAVMVYGDEDNALKAVNAIEEKNYNEAEKYIHDLQKYDKDIFNSFLDFHIKSLGEYTEYDLHMKSCLLFGVMAGNSGIAHILIKELYNVDIPENVLEKVKKYFSGLKEFIELKMLVEDVPKLKYTIRNMKDERTCKGCKKREGKSFPASKAEFGVNYPPFDDCACDYCKCYASVSMK